MTENPAIKSDSRSNYKPRERERKPFFSSQYSQTFISPHRTRQLGSRSKSGSEANIEENTRVSSNYQRGRPYGNDGLSSQTRTESQPRTHSRSRTVSRSRTGASPVIQYAPRPQYVSPYEDDRSSYSRQALTGSSYSLAVSGHYEEPYRSGGTDGQQQHNSLKNIITVRQPERETWDESDGYGEGGRYAWKINGFTDCSQTCGGGKYCLSLVQIMSGKLFMFYSFSSFFSIVIIFVCTFGLTFIVMILFIIIIIIQNEHSHDDILSWLKS